MSQGVKKIIENTGPALKPESPMDVSRCYPSLLLTLGEAPQSTSGSSDKKKWVKSKSKNTGPLPLPLWMQNLDPVVKLLEDSKPIRPQRNHTPSYQSAGKFL